MDLSVYAPECGAGGGASAPAATALSREKAKKFFEFFSRGTTRSVILLGRVVEQRMHYVKPTEEDAKRGVKGHKEPCTAVTGSCKWCACIETSTLVGPSHPEYLAPALVRKGERGEFEQRVAVFTEGMVKDLGAQFGDAPLRGQLFDLRRESHQKFKLLPGKTRTTSAALPAPFDILPFFRGRFDMRQDPSNPPVFLPAYALRELTEAPAARPEALALTASDRQSAEERSHALAKMKELLKGAVAPAPAPAPEEPAGKKPGELAVIERARDAAAYGPRERVGGTGDAPAEKLVPPAAAKSLAERRRKALEAELAERERARAEALRTDGDRVTERLTSMADAVESLADSLAPSANGKHAVGGKGGVS